MDVDLCLDDWGQGNDGKTFLVSSDGPYVCRLCVRAEFPNPPLLRESQILRRYQPVLKTYKRIFGNSEFSRIYYDGGIPLSAVQSFDKFIARQYPELEPINIYLHKMPLTDDKYFVVVVSGDRESSGYFLLNIRGGVIAETSRINKNEETNIQTLFFIGADRVLLISSSTAGDGSFFGNSALEYMGSGLRDMGAIKVSDVRVNRNNPEGWVYSPMDQATAEYRNNTYYVTMIGKGRLEGEGVQASRGAPLTYFYAGNEWLPVGAPARVATGLSQDTNQSSAPTPAGNWLGLKLELYCRAKYGSSAIHFLVGQDAFSWRCKVQNNNGEEQLYEMNMDAACSLQYGPDFKAKLENPRDNKAWHCIRAADSGSQSSGTSTERLGLNLDVYCKSKYGDTAKQVLVGQGAFSWRCELQGNLLEMNMNEACGMKYGGNFKAKYGNQQDPNSWYCEPVPGEENNAPPENSNTGRPTLKRRTPPPPK